MDNKLFEDLNRVDEQGPGPEYELAHDIAFELIAQTSEEEKVSIETVKAEIKRAMDLVYGGVVEELTNQGRMGE